MRVYIGERDLEQATVFISEPAPHPTVDEVGQVLREICELDEELGGPGRPDERWASIMARKRDLIQRIEAAERSPRPIPLPNPLTGERSGAFEWGTKTGATELAAAILTNELGETPPTAVTEWFTTDVVGRLPAGRFRLDRGEVLDWVRAYRQLVETEFYLRTPPPALAVVDVNAPEVPILGEPAPAAPVGPTASALVEACEDAWAAIQHNHPQLPDAVIILGTGVERGRLVKLGHWWGGRWLADGQVRGEVLLAGEALHLPPEQVFEVLLHEAAHGLNAARGIKDTSRGGRYHNAHFARTATEVGLVARNMPPYGLASTDLGPEARERYETAISRLGEAMRIARQIDRTTQVGVETGNGASAGEDGAEGGGRPKVQPAQCGCGRRLRMAPSVLAAGPVICGVCDTEFTLNKSASAGRSTEADAVIDHTFLERRQAELARGRNSQGADNDARLLSVLEREHARLDAVLSAPDTPDIAVLAPLRERRDRLARLVADLQPGVTSSPHQIGLPEPSASQREGISGLIARADDADVARLSAWYERFATADEAPIRVGSEADRQQNVAIARSLLKADGTLAGPAVRVDDQEFMAGDRLVVHGRSETDKIPGGALGTVERVDHWAGEFDVDFATLGRIRLSIKDVVARQLRHDYAEIAAPTEAVAWEPEALAREVQRVAPGAEP